MPMGIAVTAVGTIGRGELEELLSDVNERRRPQ